MSTPILEIYFGKIRMSIRNIKLVSRLVVNVIMDDCKKYVCKKLYILKFL